MSNPTKDTDPRHDGSEQEKLAEVIEAIQGLDFGEVVVTMHQHKIFEVKVIRRKRYKT